MRNFFIILTFIFGSFTLHAKPTVLVSIAPQKFLIEKIAGKTLVVEVIVPPGSSPHSYEPTPYQTVKIKDGAIWFRIGEGFEYRLIPLLKNAKIVDQREGLKLLCSSCGCHDISSFDLHIWLSPNRLKKMSAQIEEVLSESFPQNASLYKENLIKLISELDLLEREVSELLCPISHKIILVSHPAFGYLCDDYGITQLPIEMEGREPTPRYLSDLYRLAKQEMIQTVFLQKQYNVKGGKKLAKDLNAKIVYLDPYDENVIENIKRIAEAFSCS